MLNEFNNSLFLFKQQTEANWQTLCIIIAIPWCFFILTLLTQKRLLLLGIIPRKWYGLPGIFFAPLLHANFNHLFFNSIPLLVLGNFILISGLQLFLELTFAITIVSGALIWCFAKPGLHIGASALITGYWGYLVMNIWQQGSIMAVMLGVISLYYFSGIFLGIFPQKKGVSWEGHLFGLIAGIGCNYTLVYYGN